MQIQKSGWILEKKARAGAHQSVMTNQDGFAAVA
jgi:hypothetical protein